MLIADLLPGRAAAVAGALSLALPAALFAANVQTIRASNTPEAEVAARAHMAQLMPGPALVVGDWHYVEGMRYLQAVEGQRPDVVFDLVPKRQYILDTLARGRAVYLMDPVPELGLAQWPEGRLWRVSAEPMAAEVAAPDDMSWDDGIKLAAYTLHRGPYSPGDPVPVILDWEALSRPRGHYMMFVHLVAADGTMVGQSDREPARAPTDQWSPGGHYLDLYNPVLSPSAPPGRYQVVVGWYEYPSMRRLQLSGEAGAQDGGDVVTLGEIEVSRTP
jgi:hypothetical protein